MKTGNEPGGASGAASSSGSYLPSLVLLIGSERWRRNEALGRLKAQWLAPAFEDVDFTRFSEEPLPTQEILEALTTSPFGSARRLVVVEVQEELEEETLPWLKGYLAQPNPKALLVLCAQKMRKGTGGFFSTLGPPLAQWIPCQPLKPQELAQWVRGQFQEWDKRVEPQAQTLLIRRLGENLETLSGAIESLSLFTGARPVVTKEDVETLIALSLRETAFDILEAAAAGHPEAAVSLLRQGLQEGKLTVEQFMGALGWMYRAAWKAKSSPPFRAPLSPGMARLSRFPYPRLKKALEEVLEADARLKLSFPSPEWLADGLLLKLGS